MSVGLAASGIDPSQTLAFRPPELISHQLGMPNTEISHTVEIVDQKLNDRIVAGGSGAL
jgi:hypothetical protein